jgi:hypothetical protein
MKKDHRGFNLTSKPSGDGCVESLMPSGHEQELMAGHFGVGVTANEEEDWNKVRDILKSHHRHLINFYGPWIMENMDP